MAYRGGVPEDEQHFSLHHCQCKLWLLWLFPLALQQQNLWTPALHWGISLCWPLKNEGAGHNSPSMCMSTSYHITSHCAWTSACMDACTDSLMHECTHNATTIMYNRHFKPASEAVSLLHGQWRRTVSLHMVQSSPGIHHCPSAIVQSVLKHHTVLGSMKMLCYWNYSGQLSTFSEYLEN